LKKIEKKFLKLLEVVLVVATELLHNQITVSVNILQALIPVGEVVDAVGEVVVERVVGVVEALNVQKSQLHKIPK
jgi:hypothetical protein